MSHALLRILMAMYLAIWSPAVCCCGIKGVLGNVTGIKVAVCGETSPAVTPDEGGGCCAKKAASTAAAAIQTSHTVGSAAREQSPCRCHESVESKSRLDTGGKITLPPVTQAELPAITRALLLVCVTASPVVTKPVVSFDLPPPLRSTLLAQGCLLLI